MIKEHRSIQRNSSDVFPHPPNLKPPLRKTVTNLLLLVGERKKKHRKHMAAPAMKIVFGLLTFVTVGMIIGTLSLSIYSRGYKAVI